MLIYLFPTFLRTSVTRHFPISTEACYKATRNKEIKNLTKCFSTHSYVNTEVALNILRRFETDKSMRREAHLHGITKTLFRRSIHKFKKILMQEDNSKLSHELRFILDGIATEKYPLNALLPFFFDHTHDLYPALRQHQELKELSDLSEPTLWYPNARTLSRNITFHAGPTNSGKTHAALERFFEADRAVYCSPLRLLAREVCVRSRERGVPCDMITGDNHDYHHGSSNRASKVACTVEMTNLNQWYDVAVIDEIQMLSDIERGWAWTRAFLGVCAAEIHVCGEERASDVVSSLASDCNDKLNVRQYERLGKLRVKKKPVKTIKNLRPGDCIICFNRGQIYSYKDRLAEEGKEAAVIYGDLPPMTKHEEAKKFNDPDHPCNILITTDAIGMGLNLNIKRIIFNDVQKTTSTKYGDRKLRQLTPSHALQISGRAGRYGSQYPDGAVTAMHERHQSVLMKLLNTRARAIKKAGLHPSFERLERFARLMKSSSLYDVLSAFVSMCETDKSLYFICSLKDCLDVAEALQNVKLSLRDKYTFCLSPVSSNRSLVMAALTVYAEFYAKGLSIDVEIVKTILDWPPSVATSRKEMSCLEEVHESLRVYLWLSYRFPNSFTSSKKVRAMCATVDNLSRESMALRTPQEVIDC